MYRPILQEEQALLAAADLHWGKHFSKKEDLGNCVYHLVCDEQEWILKNMHFPLSEFSYVCGALNHLAAGGFPGVAPPIAASDGSFVLPWGEAGYVLYPFLPGLPGEYTNFQDVAAIGTGLAGLHQAAKGYHNFCYPQRLKWGGLVALFQQKHQEMMGFAKAAKDCPAVGLCELLYPRGLEDALAQSDRALALLLPCYGEVDAVARRDAGFCHHDLTPGNLLLTPERNVSFIDFDYCISDFRGHDVANLLTKILKRNHWQTAQAVTALAAYQTAYPMNPAECRVTLALLWFPQAFWQAGLARYAEGWVPEDKIARRLRLWRDETMVRHHALREMAYYLEGGGL